MNELFVTPSPSMWIGFCVLVVCLLAFDLGVFSKGKKELSFRTAALRCIGWVGCAAIFNVAVLFVRGEELGIQFLTAYLVELSLSVDNIFVFLVIFSFFRVPQKYQHKVLFYGILGSLIMRGIFIFAGLSLLHHFHWILYIFGAILVISGVKLLFHEDENINPEQNTLVRMFRRFIPVTKEFKEDNFVVRENGKLLATPLLVVLVAVEATDLLFAVDSVPAVLAISSDSFIVFTSNIFAILGLRSMYFVLAGMLAKLHFLRHGLATVLAFIGLKMLLADIYPIPTLISLAVVVLSIGVAILASVAYARVNKAK